MSLSIFALILGVHCYLWGFPLLVGDQAVIGWMKKLLKDAFHLRLFGGLFALVAAATLRVQWQVTWDGEGLVVLLAWITLLKCVFVAWWPEKYGKWKLSLWQGTFGGAAGEALAGLIVVAVGAFLTYLSFSIPA